MEFFFHHTKISRVDISYSIYINLVKTWLALTEDNISQKPKPLNCLPNYLPLQNLDCIGRSSVRIAYTHFKSDIVDDLTKVNIGDELYISVHVLKQHVD